MMGSSMRLLVKHPEAHSDVSIIEQYMIDRKCLYQVTAIHVNPREPGLPLAVDSTKHYANEP